MIKRNLKLTTCWAPPLVAQRTLWGEIDYYPQTNLRESPTQIKHNDDQLIVSSSNPRFGNYLNKKFLPPNIKVEGREEIPCVYPYTISLPQDIVGVDERVPHDCRGYGLHGFCCDSTLTQKYNNWNRVIKKAKRFHCAFGMNFSVLMDGYRCEAIEAIRKNRVTTLSLQINGIPTIQTVSFTSSRFFDIAFAGLAPNSPVAFENICVNKNRDLQYLLKRNVEELLKQKEPTVLVVIGNKLSFDPGIPVVYYKSRIQKLRDHDYNK